MTRSHIQQALDLINNFNADCQEAEYTDTDTAWEVFESIKQHLEESQKTKHQIVVEIEGGCLTKIHASSPGVEVYDVIDRDIPADVAAARRGVGEEEDVDEWTAKREQEARQACPHVIY